MKPPGPSRIIACVGSCVLHASPLVAAFSPTSSALLPHDPVQVEQRFGQAVAADGMRVAVGAPGEWAEPGVAASVCGAVHVFQRTVHGWTLEDHFGPPTGVLGSRFGGSISLQADLLAVGADNDSSLATCGGAVHLFRNSEGRWQHEATLTPPDAQAWRYFGAPVVLSGDRLAVGAVGDDEAAPGAGAVYVYRANGTDWQLEGKLTLPNAGVYESLGWSVDLSEDTVIAGAPYRSVLTSDWMYYPQAGAAYVFRSGPAGWVLESELLPAAPAADLNAGWSVAIEGCLAALGVPAGGAAPLAGEVSLFRHDGSAWTAGSTLFMDGAQAFDMFGYSLAIVDQVLAIGVPGRARVPGGPSANAGSLALYSDSSGQWSFQEEVFPLVSTVGSGFGFSLGFSPRTLVLGAPADFEISGTPEGGSAWVYDRNKPPVADASNTAGSAEATDPDGAWVILDGTRSADADDDPISYAWLLGGMTIAEGAIASVQLPPGMHTVELEVSDGRDLAWDEVDITVEETASNRPPVADASASTSSAVARGKEGALIQLDGSRSFDPDGGILQFSWDVDGTELARGVRAEVRLPAGLHLVRLVVSDGIATAEATHRVEVTTPAEATRDLALKIGRSDIRLGPKAAAFTLLRLAMRAFSEDRTNLGVHQLEVAARVLETAGRRDSNAAVFAAELRQLAGLIR